MSSSLPPDPYKILGVSKDAQLPEIRSAHRKLVLKCHPDKVQDPTLKAQKQDEFQNVQQAYELLSDENERAKYDDNVKLAELRKEMASKGISVSANTSATRSAARSYDIRTAEPRPDTFKTSSSHRPPAGAKMYSQSNSRSYDEDLYRSAPIFEEPRARRATSYEKTTYQKSSRSDEERERERDRERDRDRRRRKEEEEAAIRRERERAIAEKEREKKAIEKAAKRAAEDKEYRRRQRKLEKEAQEKAEKERDRERKQASVEKARSRKAAYVEPYGADETYVAKDKKASKKTKEEEKRSRSIPREPTREEMPPPPPIPSIPVDRIKMKTDETMMSAAEYMDKARRGVPPALNRAQTFSGFEPPIAAPTPPAASSPFSVPPPPIPTSDEDVRRSKSRRSSDTKREKSSHKKSPAKDSPYVVDASPTARPMPQFASTHSSPMGGSPPKNLGRASTFDQYSRPPPGIARAQTYHYGIETDSRGRNRSRLQSQQQTYSEESESEEDPRPRRSRHHDGAPLDYGRSKKYTVSNSRTVPVVDSYYRDESPTRKYYESRPTVTRESSAYSGAYPKVKTTTRYAPEDIQYSTIPHRYRDGEYAY